MEKPIHQKVNWLQAKNPSINLAAEPKATKGLMLEIRVRSLIYDRVAFS